MVTGVLPGAYRSNPGWKEEVMKKIMADRVLMPPWEPKRIPWKPYVRATGPNALPESHIWPLKLSPEEPKSD